MKAPFPWLGPLATSLTSRRKRFGLPPAAIPSLAFPADSFDPPRNLPE